MVTMSGGGALMADPLNFKETPNLLDLVESCCSDLSKISGMSESATCGEKSQWSSPTERSPCSDDAVDVHSVCADEGPLPPELSVCADEPPSDVRLKTDIEQVGTTVYGLPLYHFRYKTGTARFEGVMAQDVLAVMPDAVVVGEDGYYRVKYRELGIRMTKA